MSTSLFPPSNMTAGFLPSVSESALTTTPYSRPAHHSSKHLPSSSEVKLDEPEWANDDESFEVEVPDFHFDWGVSKEKTTPDVAEAPTAALVNLSLSKTTRHKQRVNSHSSTFTSSAATPPGNPGSSAQSSASSSHSLWKGSSAATRTSPIIASSSTASVNGYDLPSRPSSASIQGSESGGSGRTDRVYGSRTFQRVVSAPLASSRHHDNDDPNNSTRGSTATHTATIRPALTHTTSSSSVYPTSNVLSRTSAFTTPGIPDRTLGSSSTSTARRLGGLSRFGGPARRVAPPSESEEVEAAEGSGTSPKRTEPLREISPERPHPSHDLPLQNANADVVSQQSVPHRRSSPQAYAPFTSHPEDAGYKDHWRAQASSSSNVHSKTSPSTMEPRHQHSPVDQENAFRDRNIYNKPRDMFKEDNQGPPSHHRPLAPPLHPSQTINANQSSPPRRSAIQASRPAPIIEHRDADPRTGNQVDHDSRTNTAYSSVTAPPTVAPQILQGGKRSYVVNGAPYERVGVLGKGGSSKVYSVICPTKRVIYALKRVALDRADSETYQSYTNEIDLLKRLKGHDRIIQLIDYQITFSQGNRPKVLMMVMECGEIDFAMLLDEQRGKPVNMNFVGLYWEQMLEAVQAVHHENVVHTDLKPANFVLVKGRLKIIDFGIAKAIANDTVNIQRDQQIGTVNYMSPEAIQRMNNQKVLKLSYPSDVWSLGCILYQMIYGNAPFAHISGGPLPKMNAIADPRHVISYPQEAIPKAMYEAHDPSFDPSSLAVQISPAAIASMRRCLAYKKEERLTIPELLRHEFLRPRLDPSSNSSIPPGATTITSDQMALLVNFVLRQNGLSALTAADTTAIDLFNQLETQNNTMTR